MTTPPEGGQGGTPPPSGQDHAELREAVKEKNHDSEMAANFRKDPPR